MIKRIFGTLYFKISIRLIQISRPIDPFINRAIRKKNYTKIFCICEVKTGTTSLFHALKILGIRTTRLFKIQYFIRSTREEYINLIKKYKYDAYVDFQMGNNDLYKKLDKAFPGSKFILTKRGKESFNKKVITTIVKTLNGII